MKRFLVIGLSFIAVACTPLPREPEAPTPAPVAQEPSMAFEGDDLPPVTSGTGTIALERLLPGGTLERGSPDAAVTLLIVTHPSCGYCRALHTQLLPEVVLPYIAQGIVRMHTTILPMQKYPQTGLQAGLLLCAAKQNKGSAMLDFLMTQDVTDKAKTLKNPALPALDAKALTTCLDDPATAHSLAIQTGMADTLGIRLAPTLVINGSVHTGLPTAADLEGMLKESLADQRLHL